MLAIGTCCKVVSIIFLFSVNIYKYQNINILIFYSLLYKTLSKIPIIIVKSALKISNPTVMYEYLIIIIIIIIITTCQLFYYYESHKICERKKERSKQNNGPDNVYI